MKKYNKPVEYKFYKVPDPFPSDMSIGDRIKFMTELAEKSKKEFEEKFPAIQKWFIDYDQLYILSFCSMYFVSHAAGTDPEVEGKVKLFHHQLEILQAFALMIERNISPKPLLENAEILLQDIRNITDLIQYKQFEGIANLKTEEEFIKWTILTDIKSQTEAVRNWAYPFQIDRITKELAQLVNNKFKELYGIDADRFIDLLFSIVERCEIKLNEHRDKIRQFKKKRNPVETVNAYHAAFPNTKLVSERDLKQLWRQCGKKLNNLRYMLFCHTDLFISSIYTMNIDELVNIYGDSSKIQELTNIFDKISFKFGELKDIKKEYIILDNPCLTKPFIKIDDNNYFSSILGIMPHISLEILEFLISEDSDYLEKYSNTIKSEYLESSCENIFKNYLPNAQVYRGIKWKDNDSTVEYENDIVVIIADFIIIAECKSGKITPPAKRGAPDRVKKTLKHLITDPSIQSHRFIDLLSGERKDHNFIDHKGNTITIDSKKINYFLPLNITFENYGVITTQQKNLISSGLIDISEDYITPTMSFADLEIIFDTLPLECQKVHYLNRRREFERYFDYEGDEIDLLSFYLDTGFNIGETEFNKSTKINLIPKSKEIDPYYSGLYEGVKAEKKKHKISNYWFSILNRLATRKPEFWLQASYVLLSTTKEDQEIFIKEFQSLKINIINDNVENKHNWVEFHTGPEERRFLIIGYAYKDIGKDERNSMIANIIEDNSDKNFRGIVIIGCNVNIQDDIYSVFALYKGTNLFIND